MLVLSGNDLLKNIEHELFVPDMAGEEMLERTWRHSRQLGHWGDALSPKVGQLTAYVGREVFQRLTADEAIHEFPQISSQRGQQSGHLLTVHKDASVQ
jgi:hypothetical protein